MMIPTMIEVESNSVSCRLGAAGASEVDMGKWALWEAIHKGPPARLLLFGWIMLDILALERFHRLAEDLQIGVLVRLPCQPLHEIVVRIRE